jgi:hypothetical protein
MVVVIVAALVVVRATGGGPGYTTSPPAGTPISASITQRLSSVLLLTLTAAGTSGVTTNPQVMQDPTLTVDGKPDLLYVGAEFCPVCAVERWAMYVALSKFGTFNPQPGMIHSATRDGDIPTLTFYKTAYTSPYFTFTPVETTTNQPDGDAYVPLQKLSASQQTLWESHTGGSFPWVDFAGKAELTSAQYSPAELEGLSFSQIAHAVGNNSTQIGADIDASARVLVQTICSTLSDNQPAAVCRAVSSA